jgi:hypothetical protein
VPTGWSRITTANSAIVLGYRASSAAFSSQKGTVSYTLITTAAIGGIAAFNGDDQATGGPFPHFIRRRMFGGMTFPRGGI